MANFRIRTSLLVVFLLVGSVCASAPDCHCSWNKKTSEIECGETAIRVILGKTQTWNYFYVLHVTFNSTDRTEIDGEVTYVLYATAARYLLRLSPALMDVLSMSALQLHKRSNTTEAAVSLPSLSCDGLEEVARAMTLSILEAADIDTKDWIVGHYDDSSSQFSTLEVLLFMSVGLFAVVGTFVTDPFLCGIMKQKYWPCHNNKGTSPGAAMKLKLLHTSAVLVSAMLIGAFIVYLGLASYYYYSRDPFGTVLFPHLLLAPFTLHLIFYSLTALTALIGGFLFVNCESNGCESKAKTSCCERIGSGLLSVVLALAKYHIPFIVLALFLDPITTLQYLIKFVTVILLLLFGLAAIIRQYHKAGLKGFFILVITLEAIVLVLYSISITSFRCLILDGSPQANFASLAIVLILSILALSVTGTILALILRPPKQYHSEPTSNSHARHDVESGKSSSLVSHLPLSKSEQLQMIMLLPSLLATWKRHQQSKAAAKTHPTSEDGET